MMCCDGIYTKEDERSLMVGECESCGSPTDEDGQSCSSNNCGYSPKICDDCGWKPCDGSC